MITFLGNNFFLVLALVITVIEHQIEERTMPLGQDQQLQAENLPMGAKINV